MSRPSTLVVLLLGLVSATHGHIGGKSFAVYELPDEGLEEVDLHDGSIGEWEALLGAPSLRARPDWVDSAGHYVTAITEVPYGVVDGDWRVWLAWNRSTSRVYVAMERQDDVHVRSDVGPGIQDAWQGDSISLMIDGDHSGGEYGFYSEDDYQLANNGQAGTSLDDGNLENLFAREQQEIAQWLSRQPNFSVLNVAYTEVLQDHAQQVEILNSFLGGGLNTTAMRAAVCPDLYRQKG